MFPIKLMRRRLVLLNLIWWLLCLAAWVSAVSAVALMLRGVWEALPGWVHGVLAAPLLVAGICVAVAGYSTSSEPSARR